VYILENITPTPLGGGILADVIWGNKHIKRVKRKRRKKEEIQKMKENLKLKG
jgi:hypothetical protein